MLFSELCEYFERIEATSKRLEKTEILAELLHQLDPSEVRFVINLALGQLASAYERIEFSLAEKMLLRAIAISSQKSLTVVTKLYQKLGDMGELAASLGADVASSPGEKLSVTEVYLALVKIAQEKGIGSQERKVSGLVALLTKSSITMAKYIVRMVNESLRLGFSDSTMLDVFSYYVSGNKENSLALEKVYQMRPDLALLGEEVVRVGIAKTIDSGGIKLGIPVMPALAQRLASIDEMIQKMGVVYVEPKLDGTRVQIHYSASQPINEPNNQVNQQAMFEEEKLKIWVKTFTRNLDENTQQFPELFAIDKQLEVKEVILDAEAVGYDPVTGKLLPFQMTITRKRKHGISELQKSIPLRFFVFDVLYVDGESLIDQPLSKRREILKQIVKPGEVLLINSYIETSEASVIRDYHARQLADGLEGILVKKKEGNYEPGRAGFNWVKLKEVEMAEGKLSDTIDCVVLGYYAGKGKRNDFGLGAFLVGIKGLDEAIVTIAKIGTGLSDEQFKQLYQKLELIKTNVADPSYRVDKNLAPDFWVLPKVVVEIAADEITKSPIHSAGYALRFPRLVKFREDKGPSQITTQAEIVEMVRIVGSKHE